jgi:hypothetical protein
MLAPFLSILARAALLTTTEAKTGCAAVAECQATAPRLVPYSPSK